MNPLNRTLRTLPLAVAASALFPATAVAGIFPDEPDPERAMVYSIDVWVHTCDEKNADNDGKVSIMFRNDGDRFYLDNPGDDRKRDGFDYYQVRPEDVTRIRDITRMELKVHDGDAWCFDQVWLQINGDLVFLDNDEHWLDGDSDTHPAYHKFTSSTLRGFMWWPERGPSSPQVCRLPDEITRYDMEDMAGGLLGHMLQSGELEGDKVKRVKWRGSGAKLSRRDSNSWRLDLDLFAEVKDYWDADIDATFDIDVSCGDEGLAMKPRLRSSNAKFNVPWYVTVLTGGIANVVNAIVDANVEKKLKRKFEQASESFEIVPVKLSDDVSNLADLCPDIEIDDDGFLTLDWPKLPIIGNLAGKPALCL